MFSFFKKKQAGPQFVVLNCTLSCPDFKDKTTAENKRRCPNWVIFNHRVEDEQGNVKNIAEGKCALAWIPSLIIESKAAILNEIGKKTNGDNI